MPEPMPYTIPNGAFIEVAAEYFNASQQNIALFHYVVDSAGPIANGAGFLQDFLAELQGAGKLIPRFLAAGSEDATAPKWYAQMIHPTRYAYVTLGDADPFTGPAGSEPPNVSAAITKKGIAANRSGVGTLHMGAVPQSWTANGYIVEGIGEQYTMLAEALYQPYGVGEANLWPVLYNRTTPADSQFIVQAFLQPAARVMRRRTVGLGK